MGILPIFLCSTSKRLRGSKLPREELKVESHQLGSYVGSEWLGSMDCFTYLQVDYIGVYNPLIRSPLILTPSWTSKEPFFGRQ